MNRSRKPSEEKLAMKFISLLLLFMQMTAAGAHIRVTDKWASEIGPDGRFLPDDQIEKAHSYDVAEKYAESMNAAAPYQPVTGSDGVILFVNDVKYYLRAMHFMPKIRPDEVCTPDYTSKHLTYDCAEGQKQTANCHLITLNTRYEVVGTQRVDIHEPFKSWCNQVLGIGTADKAANELLVTVQYFNVEHKAASRISEVGDSWRRMTLLFHVKDANGKIELAADTRCLKNPNSIETIPEARKALKLCGVTK